MHTSRVRYALCILLTLWALGPSPLAAEEGVDPNLAAGVQALEAGDHARGLELLKKAAETSDDPRIRYYTAYALEKSGRCDEARAKYQEALIAGPEQFTAAARDALEGFDVRCVVSGAEPPPVDTRARPGSRGTGWRVLGWVSASLGAIALGAVPVKSAFDHRTAAEAEQALETRYQCTIDFGVIGDDCDEDEVRANEYWPVYEEKVALAKQTNVALIVGGAGLLALGVTSFIIGVTRPAVAVVPVEGGAVFTWGFRF